MASCHLLSLTPVLLGLQKSYCPIAITAPITSASTKANVLAQVCKSRGGKGGRGGRGGEGRKESEYLVRGVASFLFTFSSKQAYSSSPSSICLPCSCALASQAWISQARVDGFALTCDLNYVSQNLGRIVRALFEVSPPAQTPRFPSTIYQPTPNTSLKAKRHSLQITGHTRTREQKTRG